VVKKVEKEQIVQVEIVVTIAVDLIVEMIVVQVAVVEEEKDN
jgi:hypothetical protein